MTTITLEDIKQTQQQLADMISALARVPATIFSVDPKLPEMNPGERYAGCIISADGAIRHHIILLPGDIDSTSWKKQMEWAASIGGELPGRVESALLFATMKDEFKPEWYWLREQHASDSVYAWLQTFGDGTQDYYSTRASASGRGLSAECPLSNSVTQPFFQ
jgi:hypothetical protein